MTAQPRTPSLLAVLIGLLMAGGSAATASTVSPDVQPRLGDGPGAFRGVGALSANDVWIVGCCTDNRGSAYHWNGVHWQPFATPARTGQLLSVDGVSTSDVWAAGYTGIIHWDGKQWSTSYFKKETLSSISADAADDAWAVGGVSDGQGGITTVALHWDGTGWRDSGLHTTGLFTSVSALGPDDVWAVGEVQNSRGLIEHWDGSSWHEVTSPDPEFYTLGVTALSSSDVWIVGESPEQAETEHWDGTELVVVPCPEPEGDSELSGVSAASTTDVWAVGERDDGDKYRPLTMHWDGDSWSLVTGPPARHHKTWLADVAAISPDDAWTVGYNLVGNRTDYQVLGHWNGSYWKRLG